MLCAVRGTRLAVSHSLFLHVINAEEVKSLGGEAANEANEAWLNVSSNVSNDYG